MRQAGYLAAAGIHAIQHHLPKLALDHEHAAKTAAVLAKKSWVSEIMPPETNILIFKTTPEMQAPTLVKLLAEKDIHCLAISPEAIRFVFHLDVSSEQVDFLCQILEDL
jgi:threonine aldolase